MHVNNLPLDTTEEGLRNFFSKYGPVNEVKIIRKNSVGIPLKDHFYGFVHMETAEGARNAVVDFVTNKPNNWSVTYSKDKRDFVDKN